MTKLERKRLGGQMTALKLRSRALALYYENPTYCGYCGTRIEVRDGQKVAEVRKKKYCDRSCAARENNGKRKRRLKEPPEIICQKCKETFHPPRRKTGGFTLRKYCDDCLGWATLKQRTKEELFRTRKNWQSAASSVRKHARSVYYKSGKPKCCLLCGYDIHIEICHVRDVASFKGNTTIGEINNIKNLVALCRNHHWEHDHGLIEI